MFTLVKVFHDISYVTIWIKIIHPLCAATRFSHNFKDSRGYSNYFLRKYCEWNEKKNDLQNSDKYSSLEIRWNYIFYIDPSLTFHVDASLDLCLTKIVRPEERSRLVSQPWISSVVPSSNRVTQTKRESSETSRHALEPQHEEISVEAVQSDSGGSLARMWAG